MGGTYQQAPNTSPNASRQTAAIKTEAKKLIQVHFIPKYV